MAICGWGKKVILDFFPVFSCWATFSPFEQGKTSLFLRFSPWARNATTCWWISHNQARHFELKKTNLEFMVRELHSWWKAQACFCQTIKNWNNILNVCLKNVNLIKSFSKGKKYLIGKPSLRKWSHKHWPLFLWQLLMVIFFIKKIFQKKTTWIF